MTTLDVSPHHHDVTSRRGLSSVVINGARTTTPVERLLSDSFRPGTHLPVGPVSSGVFVAEFEREFERRRAGGRNAVVASMSLFEVPALHRRLGARIAVDLMTSVIELLGSSLEALDVVNATTDGVVVVLMRGRRRSDAIDRLERACTVIAGHMFEGGGERIRLSPSVGFTTLDDGESPAQLLRRANIASDIASSHLDLRPQRWTSEMPSGSTPDAEDRMVTVSVDSTGEAPTPKRFEWARVPVQIVATYVLGFGVPFLGYWALDSVGVSLAWFVYPLIAAVLVVTGLMILVESTAAIKQRPPPEPTEAYPLATALICAYLPNEAGTILDTLDSFITNGYPGGLQIVLAYNTPEPLPVEDDLRRLAMRHPNLHVVQVEGSNSKAQNVNAALHLCRGEFTAMFDADHQPRPGSFERAWAWLSNGYDVVQGHCLIRNGADTGLARMVAVEFESIYAVAHPGRARLHGFGIFGGSNGYWRTNLLLETRMRGSMLTEDIDSALRVVERGHKIRSDRDIVSRELGTTTFNQVWNQRLRWSQGWFQVTKQHTRRVWTTKHLSLRQRLGMTYLLGWRELYPWISVQVFPLIAYAIISGAELDWFHPIYLLTTLFVMFIGPAQTWFAYHLADPEIREHKRWFVAHLFFSTLFYTEYKNLIVRLAHVKELVGERSWRVTPRTEESVELEPVDRRP